MLYSFFTGKQYAGGLAGIPVAGPDSHRRRARPGAHPAGVAHPLPVFGENLPALLLHFPSLGKEIRPLKSRDETSRRATRQAERHASPVVLPFPGFDTPRQRNRPPFARIDPWDPATYSDGPDFDVVDELAYNLDLYVVPRDPEARSDMPYRHFPKNIESLLERICERAGQKMAKGRPPATGPAYVACLTHGMAAFVEHPHIRVAMEAKRMFNLCDFEDAEAYEVVDRFINMMPSERTVTGPTIRKRWTVPADLASSIGDVAKGLGTTKTTVALLALKLTLSTQPAVHKRERAQFDDEVSSFLRFMRRKGESATLIMQNFQP